MEHSSIWLLLVFVIELPILGYLFCDFICFSCYCNWLETPFAEAPRKYFQDGRRLYNFYLIRVFCRKQRFYSFTEIEELSRSLI